MQFLTIRKTLCLFALGAFGIAQNASAQEVYLNEIMSSNATLTLPIGGGTPDWIEIYNPSTEAIDLTGYSLSDNQNDPDKWTFEGIVISSGDYLVVFASNEPELSTPTELHTNFSISADGESIYLFDPANTLLDSSPEVSLSADISIGRAVGEPLEWVFFQESTPFVINSSETFSGVAQKPILSFEGGVYQNPVSVQHVLDNEADIVHYTLDGSEPTEADPVLPELLEVIDTKILRIKTFRPDYIPSLVFTNSYIFNEELVLDIISLTTEEANFFGDEGIYTNYSSGLEKPIHVECFNATTGLEFKSDMGVKIHAPDNRVQKSLRLYARAEYGNASIDYPIFEDRDNDYYKTLVLRNAGNDGIDRSETHLRDPFVHQLFHMEDPDYSYSAYRPVSVFLNGEYWGIYNLRERQDEHFMESNHGLAPDEVDFLEYDYAEPGNMKTISGDWDDWYALNAFMITEDMSLDANYQTVLDWIDIDNFIDYMSYEIFVGNQDWCNNNIKFYRPIEDGGKWRWVIWDTEYGLATFDSYPIGEPDFDFFGMAYSWCGWGAGDYSWMFRTLFDNDEFQTKYLIRTQDLINTNFKPEFMNAQFQALADVIEPDVDNHADKWGSSMGNWNSSIGHTNSFINQRADGLRANMSSRLEISPVAYTLQIDLSIENAGYIALNTVVLNDQTMGWDGNPFPFEGIYLEDTPISATAFSYLGFEFSHWEGDINTTDATIEFDQLEDISVTAVYIEVNIDDLGFEDLVINEVMSSNISVYMDEANEFEDWIEIFNAGNETVNLSGLYLTDDITNPFKWMIPYGNENEALLNSDDHMVFFADEDQEQGFYHTNFQLSAAGEEVALVFRNAENEPVILDQIVFGSIDDDQSYGRNGDGSSDWIVFPIPTPDAANDIIDGIEEKDAFADVMVYPNPTINTIHFRGLPEGVMRIDVYNMTGQQVYSNRIAGQAICNLEHLPNGIYAMQVTTQDGVILGTKKIVKQ